MNSEPVTQMSAAAPKGETVQLPVDPEHIGLRVSIMLLFFVLWFAVFIVIRSLIPIPGIDVIALVAGFAVTALSNQRIENYLKQHWPSGRLVRLNDQSIQLVKRQQVESEVDPSQRVNVLLWHFRIGRRSRVKRGWLVVACALEQDDTYVAVYSFMPPENFEEKNYIAHFSLLQNPKEQNVGRGQKPMQLAGIQRRLHVAERVRWLDGAEMTQDNFHQYLKLLQDRFPEWMPVID